MKMLDDYSKTNRILSVYSFIEQITQRIVSHSTKN